MSAGGGSAKELAALVGAETALEARLLHVSSIDAATSEAVVFALDEATLAAALRSDAGMIFAKPSTRAAAPAEDKRVVRVREPKLAFALCARALAQPEAGPLRHATATIDPSAIIGERSRIGAGAVFEADVVMGKDCSIGSRATVCRGAVLGDRVVVQPGAVLGSTGFGYVRDAATGEYVLFPQQGRLVIDDDVEIGANTTIDCGALGETRIGKGTKIDNLVHIGHNCLIGRNVVIAAQVGISGSCEIGDGAVLAGQVGISDHCRIGPGVILGGQAGVFVGKTVEGPDEMFAGTPAEPLKDYLKSIARVRRLR